MMKDQVTCMLWKAQVPVWEAQVPLPQIPSPHPLHGYLNVQIL